MTKKIMSFILALVLLSGVAACDKTSNNSNDDNVQITEIADIWGAPGTEKVLQNVSDIYDEFATEAKIDLMVAKGELEGSHIIISAKKNLKYTLDIRDLKMQDGTVFSANNIEAFHEKYVDVVANYENNSKPTGRYPDALIPFDAVKKLGENIVNQGENQGIYYRFNIPIDQKTGVYQGSFSLTIGNSSMTFPVSLNVTGAVVSEIAHAKNIFLNEWSFSKGELDTTEEMLDRYTQALFEYRLSPNKIVIDSNHTDEDIAYYTEKAYEFMQNPKCTNIQIPYRTVVVNGENCIDSVIFDKYLTAFANKSFETGFNMLEKSVCYIGIIDEPQYQNLLNRVKEVSNAFRNQLTATSNRIEADNTINSAIKNQVVESIRKIKNVVTAPYLSAYAPYIDTWCPQVQHYDSESLRAYYADQEEKWWYTCVSPRAPYPTYHTEDTLLSARALSWMQAEYDVVGNLFWATNIYAVYNGDKYVEIEEYYEGNALRFPNVNGDGYLFYPGKKYGIDGPLGSLRLEAIRDGLEEYELLYEIKDIYNRIGQESQVNFDEQKLIQSLSSLIYNGTKVATTSEKFMSARKSLLQLSELAVSDAKFCVIDFADDGYDTITYKFFAAQDAVVLNNGIAITAKQQVVGGYVYTVPVKLENKKNTLNILIQIDGKAYDYSVELGGIATVVESKNYLSSDFEKEGVTPVFSLIDANLVDTSLLGKMAKIDLPAITGNVSQSFRVVGNVVQMISSNTEKITLHIYYSGTDNPLFAVSSKFSKQMTYSDLINTNLKQGMNEITMSLSSQNWAKLGDIQYLTIYLADKGNNPARSVYIADWVIYEK